MLECNLFIYLTEECINGVVSQCASWLCLLVLMCLRCICTRGRLYTGPGSDSAFNSHGALLSHSLCLPLSISAEDIHSFLSLDNMFGYFDPLLFAELQMWTLLHGMTLLSHAWSLSLSTHSPCWQHQYKHVVHQSTVSLIQAAPTISFKRRR